MMESYLEPCPFCGARYPRLMRDGICDFYYYVKCCNCGARTGIEYTEELAVKNWNRRVRYER